MLTYTPRFALFLSLLTITLPLTAQINLNDYVACWDFNEGQGTTLYDRSTNSFDGQLFGAQWSTGISGSALAFNGTSDYVEITDGNGHPDLIGNLAEGTVSMWFKFNTITAPMEIHPIFYLGDGIGGPTNSSFIVEIGHFGTDAQLYFTILDGTGFPIQCYDSGFNLQTNTWYHFAVVVGPNHNTGYLNGMEMMSRHYNFGTAATHDFFQEVQNKQVCWFGKGKLGFNPADQWFDGTMDEIRIYDRPLSAPEIQMLMSLAYQTYPGTQEDFVLGTGINGAPCTTGGSADIKQVARGGFLTVCLDSPGWTFIGDPLLLAGDLVPMGQVNPSPALAGLWLTVPGFFILVDGTQITPLGFSQVVAPGGTCFGFQIPLTLPSSSLVLQGGVLSMNAANGLALSPAHQIQIF